MNTVKKMFGRALLVSFCLTLLCGCRAEKVDYGYSQVVNPIVEVGSVQEMEERLGYSVPVLEKSVEVYIVLVIDGAAESGRIRYSDGSIFNIQRGSGDISGIYGGVLEAEEVIAGIAVSVYAYEGLRYAIWEKDGFAYSLTGGDALLDDVAALIA